MSDFVAIVQSVLPPLLFAGILPTMVALLGLWIAYEPTSSGGSPSSTSPQGHTGTRRKPTFGNATLPRLGLEAFLAGLIVWVVFLAWTPEQIGLPKGSPYATWQVGACIVAAVAVELVLIWRARYPKPAVFAVALGFIWGFSIPWALWAAPSDQTGMWGVGLIFLMWGSMIGLLLVGTLFALFHTFRVEAAMKTGRN